MRAAGAHQHVVKVRIQRHGLVGRQRPRGRRPDDDVGGRGAQGPGRGADACLQIAVVEHPEAHIDGGRGVILVLHFGLGERRAAVEAPVHGFDALVEVAVGDDATEHPDLVRLVLRVHGEVGMIPVTQHAQTLEIHALLGRPAHVAKARQAARKAAASSFWPGRPCFFSTCCSMGRP